MVHRSRRVARPLACLALAATATAASLAVGSPATAATPAPGALRDFGDFGVETGRAAAELVVQAGDEFAVRHGFESATDLAELFVSDDAAQLYDTGHIVFADAAPGVLPGAAGAHVDTLRAAADQWRPEHGIPTVPVHASKPHASKHLFLDFAAGEVANTWWNRADPPRGYGLTFYAAPYSTDVNVAEFSELERGNIARIVESVADDYSPFDVNVTTVRPPAGADVTRVIITSNYFLGEIGDRPYGGIAVVGGSGARHPAFAFSSNLGFFGTGRGVAETVAHEAGHALGLSHDSVTLGDGTRQEYYPGGRWSPIMGTSHYATYSQWSRGDYPGAVNGEDDIAILAQRLGLAPDDRPGTTTIGYGLTRGHIGVGDVDTFAVHLAEGSAKISLRAAGAAKLHAVDRFGTRGNYFPRFTLADPSGTTVAVVVPPTVESATPAELAVDVALAGVYTISVEPGAWKSWSEQGFDAYGSLGAFELTVAAVPSESSTGSTGSPPAAGSPSPPDVMSMAPDPHGGYGVSAVPPHRVLDTRESARVPASSVTEVVIPRLNSVAISGAVVNVTAVNPDAAGYLTVYSCDADRPLASTVNYATGEIVGASTTVGLDASDRLCVYTVATTDLLVDVMGLVETRASNGFVPVGPIRLADTRATGRLAEGATLHVDVASVLPVGAQVASITVTAVQPAGAGHITVHPCASDRPDTSMLNYTPGDTRANSTVVGTQGGVCVYSHADTDVIVDITGGFVQQTLGNLTAITPQRVVDTRSGRPLAAGETMRVAVDPSVVPAAAHGLSLTITAVTPSAPGHLTVFPCAESRPNASTVNYAAREVRANATYVAFAGGLCVHTHAETHVVIDVTGYTRPPG